MKQMFQEIESQRPQMPIFQEDSKGNTENYRTLKAAEP